MSRVVCSRFVATVVAVFGAMLIPAMAQADEAAVRKTLASYVEAFNQRNSKAVGSFWTTAGMHRNSDTGEEISGRDAISADLATVFQERPQVKLSARVDKLRMVRPDVAKVHGEAVLTEGTEEPSITLFDAILVVEDGKWLIDSLEERQPPKFENAGDALAQLDGLIGTWVDEGTVGDGARVESTFRRSGSGAFLLRTYSFVSKEGEAENGTQVIGWDAGQKLIRSWSFHSDGSFGEGYWSKSGEEWLIRSTQTLADGRGASGTYVLKMVDADTLTFQVVGHEVDGHPQPAAPVSTMKRVPLAPEAAAVPAEGAQPKSGTPAAQ
jgi:uncharacterized protein (TIGR02246 family)